ncbi:MAG: PhzF family phenazine biosynthesis protein, partial [Pseudomonadota bacterium]
PNIGTAWVLAQLGRFGDLAGGIDTCFAEQAGTVDIHVTAEGGTLDVTLRAPEALSIGEPLAAAPLAAALGLDVSAIKIANHAPCEVSVGLPFTVIELASKAALAAAVVNTQALQDATALGVNPDLYCYCRDGSHIAARMFAPFDGVPEDPATGSATCAAAGLLASLATTTGELAWSFVQGVEMGRPSRLEARTRREADAVTDIWLSGQCVPFAVGELTLP